MIDPWASTSVDYDKLINQFGIETASLPEALWDWKSGSSYKAGSLPKMKKRFGGCI